MPAPGSLDAQGESKFACRSLEVIACQNWRKLLENLPDVSAVLSGNLEVRLGAAYEAMMLKTVAARADYLGASCSSGLGHLSTV